MAEELKLNKPWLVAVWPGIGHVAISAGYYLMAKLGMHVLAEFSPRELFDVEHVDARTDNAPLPEPIVRLNPAQERTWLLPEAARWPLPVLPPAD
jgi:hypothetical protein